jgi:two-component sensor histidine kinase
MNSVERTQSRSVRLPIAAISGLIVLLFSLFFLVLGLSIFRDYRDAQQRAADRAQAGAQVVATNALWISELARQALGRIDDVLGPYVDRNAAVAGGMIFEATKSLPGNVKAYVVAADGRTLFSTDPDVKPIDIRDRPYFSELANGALWYVSPMMVSRLDGAQIFVFSKRLSRNGAFVGAAVISFDVTLLRGIWESLDLDEQSTVSLFRDDGQLVARFPLAEGPLDLSKYVLFTKYLKEADVGTYQAISPADGIARTVGYRRVPETRFIALSSISTHSALALFWRNVYMMLAFALPTAIGLAGAAFWILRLLRADQQTTARLVEALELNQMLVRDTHHRVKNNLQAIMSMVRMHPLPAVLKQDLSTRIAAMSAVHESLYRLDRFTDVDAPSLVRSVIEPLRESFGRPVDIRYDIEPVRIDRDNATPLALLINELVTNSIKYAFPDRETGRIGISLKQSSQEAVLVIEDDGIGFDQTMPSQGLGTRLIRSMMLQLGGTYQYTFAGGTRFEARFRWADADAARA